MLKKTITANYQHIGRGNSFYKQGETYHLTIEFKGWLWRKHIEVTCRHGYHDIPYVGSGTITYKDEETFNEDWKAV